MKIISNLVIIDIETNEVEFKSAFEWDGPVALAKKGREQVTEAANRGNQLADEAKGWAETDRSLTTPFAKSLLPGSNGALSPYVTAQLNRQKSDIVKTYDDIAQTGMKAAQQRGFGSAPSGNIASIYNTAGRNAGEAERNAYADAQNRTLGAGIEGMNYLDPNKAAATSTGANSGAAQAGYMRSQMGSGLSDVMGGLGGIMKLGSGIAGMGGFSGIGKSLWSGNR